MKPFNINSRFDVPEGPGQQKQYLFHDFLKLQNIVHYVIFQNGSELVLIQRMLIGFEITFKSKKSKTIPVAFNNSRCKNRYNMRGKLADIVGHPQQHARTRQMVAAAHV